MKTVLFAAAALSLATILPASAQMAGAGMAPGMGTSNSCVSGGQFVPCSGGMMQGNTMQGGTMQPGMRQGMAMQDEGAAPKRRMTRAEKRRMMREQQGM